MKPALRAGRGATRFQDHLVEMTMLLDEAGILLQNLIVGDEEVGSLAQGVLTARHAVHSQVQLRTAIATRNGDDSEILSQGFQYLLAEHHQADDDDGILRRVVDAILDGGDRTEKLS